MIIPATNACILLLGLAAGAGGGTGLGLLSGTLISIISPVAPTVGFSVAGDGVGAGRTGVFILTARFGSDNKGVSCLTVSSGFWLGNNNLL